MAMDERSSPAVSQNPFKDVPLSGGPLITEERHIKITLIRHFLHYKPWTRCLKLHLFQSESIGTVYLSHNREGSIYGGDKRSECQTMPPLERRFPPWIPPFVAFWKLSIGLQTVKKMSLSSCENLPFLVIVTVFFYIDGLHGLTSWPVKPP